MSKGITIDVNIDKETTEALKNSEKNKKRRELKELNYLTERIEKRLRGLVKQEPMLINKPQCFIAKMECDGSLILSFGYDSYDNALVLNEEQIVILKRLFK